MGNTCASCKLVTLDGFNCELCYVANAESWISDVMAWYRI